MIVIIEIIKIIISAIYEVFVQSVSYLMSLIILVMVLWFTFYLIKLIINDLKKKCGDMEIVLKHLYEKELKKNV